MTFLVELEINNFHLCLKNWGSPWAWSLFHSMPKFHSPRKVVFWLLVCMTLSPRLGLRPWGTPLQRIPNLPGCRLLLCPRPLPVWNDSLGLWKKLKWAQLPLHFYHVAGENLLLFEIWGSQRRNSFAFPFQIQKVWYWKAVRSEVRSHNSPGTRYVFPDLF